MRAARLARRSCLEVRRSVIAPYLLPMQLSEPTQSARPDRELRTRIDLRAQPAPGRAGAPASCETGI